MLATIEKCKQREQLRKGVIMIMEEIVYISFAMLTINWRKLNVIDIDILHQGTNQELNLEPINISF